jgi:signal peptidase I
MAQPDVAIWVRPKEQPRRRIGRIVFWGLVGLAAAALILSIAIPIATIGAYTEQSPTMEKTIFPGDRLFVASGTDIRRGDVVVLRVPARQSRTGSLFIKRVIGLPGDHVACCDAKGQLTVNGKPLDETYVYPGNRPALSRFSVTLGRGQIWVMGDHRNISVDSRKWGPVPVSGVVGRVVFVGRGSDYTALRTPHAFVSDGLAPADTRPDLYLRLAFLAVASIAALLLLTAVGITRFVIRRRGARRVAAARPLVEPMYGVYRIPPPRQGDPTDTSGGGGPKS